MTRETRKKKRRTGNILLCVFIVLFLALAYVGGTMYIEYQSDGAGTQETVTIEIEQGEGTFDIASKLKEEGLIQYRSIFFLKAKNMGAKLRYGTFAIPKDSGLETIINVLTSGGAMKEEPMFTVPEGYSIEMIAAKLEEEGFCTEDEFLQAVKQDYGYWFLEDIPQDADVKYRLQGFLYPDTYAISENMTAEDIVTTMLNQFNDKFTSEMQNQMKVLGKTVYQVVIEASIVEREAVVDKERATIAGVINNRLAIDMKLQMCPTALYPITEGLYDKDTVTNADTEYDSPYNTYKYKGLPPGPIANPGMASLQAVLEPETHEYLYYHVDPNKNDGSHIFSKTYKDHVNTQ